jgi:hypothetical protein
MKRKALLYTIALLSGVPVASAQGIPPECIDLPPGTPCSSGEVGDGEPAGEPSFDRSQPGTLIVNAQDGNGMLANPHDGLSFGSEAEAMLWAEANLNATVIRDEAGKPKEVQGSLWAFGKLFYVDDSS